MQLIGLAYEARDFVFPLKQPLSAATQEARSQREQEVSATEEARIAALPDTTDALKEHLASCASLVAAEDERRSGVEGRLTSIIGLSSIAGTVVFGSIRNQADAQAWLRWVFALGALYLTAQLSSAILAAVRGLKRRSYYANTPQDVLPLPGEASTVHLRRQITHAVRALHDDQAQDDEKVTQMAVAHRAMYNFVGGLLIIAIVGTLQAVRTTPGDAFAERVRHDPALRELLRGPQGPPGPPGPKGDNATPAPQTHGPKKPPVPKGRRQ
jgi:hypothetical protein